MTEKVSKIRIADIAELAQVSEGTVDRVIHNRSGVAAKTRARVLKIIEEMNYEPDILASTLASKKNFRFASLIPESDENSKFWASPAAGIRKALDEVKHFGVFLDACYFKYFERESFNQAAQKMLLTKPDGIILAPVFSDLADNFMSQCVERNIPVVIINSNNIGLDKLSFVGQDAFSSGMVAARLLDYGVTPGADFLIVNFKNEKSTNMHLLNREEGFRNFFSSGSAPKRNLHTINLSESDSLNMEDLLLETLNQNISGHPIKGVFVTNSRVFRIADFLKNAGIDDLRLVGYDLLDENVKHLREVRIDFLIGQRPFEQGFRSFMALFDAVVLKKSIRKYQYLPIDIITNENIDFYLNNLTNE